jgi:hypothetical protein
MFGMINSYHVYLNNYLGLRHKIDLKLFEHVEEAPVAAVLVEMPQYPDPGSIAVIGEKIYVKFSFDPDNPPVWLFN